MQHSLERAKKFDLSSRAINRAVMGESLQKPYVLYPVAAGVLGIMGALLIGPSLPFLIPAVVGSLVGGGALLLDNTLMRDKHARHYLQSMRDLLSNRLQQTVDRLQKEFSEDGFSRGLDQLHRLNRKFKAFRELLSRKLDPGELTYGRYLGMTEQVFLAGLDNLQQVSNTLQGIRVIDGDALEKRIGELRGKSLDELQSRELEALESRMLLFRQHEKKIAALLTQNEEAMTRIDQVMAAISTMSTEQAHAGMDMESAMKELKELVARADDYSIQQ